MDLLLGELREDTLYIGGWNTWSRGGGHKWRRATYGRGGGDKRGLLKNAGTSRGRHREGCWKGWLGIGERFVLAIERNRNSRWFGGHSLALVQFHFLLTGRRTVSGQLGCSHIGHNRPPNFVSTTITIGRVQVHPSLV